jgi:glycosyltransferase involved in cell wall biosynthesis
MPGVSGLRRNGLSCPPRETGEQASQTLSMPVKLEVEQAEIVSSVEGSEGGSGYVPAGDGTHPFYRTLTIIVPVYNERKTVMTILERVLRQDTAPLGKEIVVVDDCSTDGSREYLIGVDWDGICHDSGDSVQLLLHGRNLGKGACVQSALQRANGELILIQDADLEYDPADYPALLRPILDGHADAVFGNRFHPNAHRVPRYYRFVLNRMFSSVCNLLTGLALNDVTACYKVLRRDTLRRLRLKSKRFSIETELTVKLSKTSTRIHEVPIVYHGRTHAEGKKIRWLDGLVAAYNLFRYRFF